MRPVGLLAFLCAAGLLVCPGTVQSAVANIHIQPTHNCTQLELLPLHGVAPCVCTFNSSDHVDGALVWWVGNQAVATGKYGVTSLRFPHEKLSGYHLGMRKRCRVKFSNGSLSAEVRLPDGLAYGPDNVTIRYYKANNTEGVEYIRVICDVSLFYPMDVDMIQWRGQCQGQEDVTCSLAPEEADGKEVGCKVTNFANNNKTVEAAVKITLNEEVKSGWGEDSLVLVDANTTIDKEEQRNETGLKLMNCNGHEDVLPGLVSLRQFLGLRPSRLKVVCEGLSGQADSTVHWTLVTATGHALDLGSCSGHRCRSNALGLELRQGMEGRSSVPFALYPRELNGVLTCTEQYHDGQSKSANCSFGYVTRPTSGGCEVTIERENWTVVIQCTVQHLYPLHAYEFHMTELYQNTMFGSPIPTRTPFPKRPVYLTTPYINDTDHRVYYRVVVVYRRPLQPVSDVFYTYRLTVNPGESSFGSDPTRALHVVHPSQISINCTRTFHVIDHALTTSSRTCYCATTRVGSPAGRLLWLLGEGDHVMARSQYGVTYLEFHIEEGTILDEGMTITCRLDWVENQTMSMLLHREVESSVSSAGNVLAAGTSDDVSAGGIMKPISKHSEMTAATTTTNTKAGLDEQKPISMETLVVWTTGFLVLVIIIVVVAVIAFVKCKREQRWYGQLPVSDEAFPTDQPPNLHLSRTPGRGLQFAHAWGLGRRKGILPSGTRRSGNSGSAISLPRPHLYSIIPSIDSNVYEDIDHDSPTSTEDEEEDYISHLDEETISQLAARQDKICGNHGEDTSRRHNRTSGNHDFDETNRRTLRANRVKSRSADDLRNRGDLYPVNDLYRTDSYLTPVNDFYLTPVNDSYLTPANDFYLTPVNDLYLTPVNDFYLTPTEYHMHPTQISRSQRL